MAGKLKTGRKKISKCVCMCVCVCVGWCVCLWVGVGEEERVKKESLPGGTNIGGGAKGHGLCEALG